MTDEEAEFAADGAGEAEPKPSKPKRPGTPPPNRVAEDILADYRIGEDDGLMTDDAGQVYVYKGGCWTEVSDIALRKAAGLKDGRRHTSGKRRGEIVSFIKDLTYRKIQWGRVEDYEVAAANCVVDARNAEPRNHRPRDYLERVIPHPFTPEAPAEAWLGALATWFGEWDEHAPAEVVALQEFFGYVVLSHAKFKKALLLYGGSDTGKSVVVDVLKELVGEKNTCSLPVDQMDNPQRRAVIKGKLLNVVSEITADAMISDGGFKQLISTEEGILIDEKYKPSEMYIPRAKHCVATNTLPRLNDRTEATLNRLLIIPMLKVIPKEQQDETLKARLKAEMPGILWWAIQGAKRLIAQRGQFTAVPSAAAVLAELRADANPARLYLAERCDPQLTAAIPLSVLAKDYNSWASGNRKVTPRTLGKMLRDCGQRVKNVRDGKLTAACLIGYTLRKESTKAQYAVPVGTINAPDDAVDAISEGVNESTAQTEVPG